MSETKPKHTPGPWEWRVQDKRVMLGTVGRGFTFVMGFTRVGMQGAEPMFQVHREGCDQTCKGCGVMTPATELANPRDHNGVGFLDHPDAMLMKASPDLLEAARHVLAEWDAERLAWSENRLDVLSLETPQPERRAGFDELRAAIAKAEPPDA